MLLAVPRKRFRLVPTLRVGMHRAYKLPPGVWIKLRTTMSESSNKLCNRYDVLAWGGAVLTLISLAVLPASSVSNLFAAVFAFMSVVGFLMMYMRENLVGSLLVLSGFFVVIFLIAMQADNSELAGTAYLANFGSYFGGVLTPIALFFAYLSIRDQKKQYVLDAVKDNYELISKLVDCEHKRVFSADYMKSSLCLIGGCRFNFANCISSFPDTLDLIYSDSELFNELVQAAVDVAELLEKNELLIKSAGLSDSDLNPFVDSEVQESAVYLILLCLSIFCKNKIQRPDSICFLRIASARKLYRSSLKKRLIKAQEKMLEGHIEAEHEHFLLGVDLEKYLF